MYHQSLLSGSTKNDNSIGKLFKKGAAAIITASVLLSAADASRPATFWVTPSGDFFDPSNWNLGAPGTTLDARIDNGGIAQISYPGFQTIPYVYLGSAQNTTGTLEIIAGGEASFTTMIVGAVNSTGTLRINNGGKLTSFGGAIGSDYLGIGTGTVTGPGSSWNVTGSEMVVGGNGTGTIRLENGGSLTIANGSGRMQLGNHPVSEGKLYIGNGGAAGTLSASEIYNGEGKATVVFNHNNPSLTFASKLTGTKTINGYLNILHEGSGTTIFTAAESNLAGSITVAAGTLIVNGKIMGNTRETITEDGTIVEKTIGTTSVLSGGTLGGAGFFEGDTTIKGTLSPGMGTGLMQFGGNLTLEAGSTLKIEIGGRSRGGTFDGIDVDGALNYGGTLEIVFLGGFEPNEGETFDLFEKFDSYNGAFSNILFSAEDYFGEFDPQTGLLTVIPEPTTGGLAALAVAMLGLRRPQTSRRVAS